eukprot:25679-Chlamydomonas_euryale.AAC.1
MPASASVRPRGGDSCPRPGMIRAGGACAGCSPYDAAALGTAAAAAAAVAAAAAPAAAVAAAFPIAAGRNPCVLCAGGATTAPPAAKYPVPPDEALSRGDEAVVSAPSRPAAPHPRVRRWHLHRWRHPPRQKTPLRCRNRNGSGRRRHARICPHGCLTEAWARAAHRKWRLNAHPAAAWRRARPPRRRRAPSQRPHFLFSHLSLHPPVPNFPTLLCPSPTLHSLAFARRPLRRQTAPPARVGLLRPLRGRPLAPGARR